MLQDEPAGLVVRVAEDVALHAGGE
jgi:hypothetical protein